MSPWLRSEVRVMLSPREVTLQPLRRVLGWRGVRVMPGEPRVLACHEANGAHPWRPAVQAFEAATSDLLAQVAAATVVLSNHFIRYSLLPWHDELSPGDEEMAWARHCFSRLYGSAADQWAIQVSPQPGTPRLACAVDSELLEALREACVGSGCVLRSVQPHLMAVFNGSRRQLHGRRAWLALLEPGHICLALLNEDLWRRIRSVRIAGSWRDELPPLLEREAYLSEDPGVPHEVHVWSVDEDLMNLPQWGPWCLHALEPGGQGRARGWAIAG